MMHIKPLLPRAPVTFTLPNYAKTTGAFQLYCCNSYHNTHKQHKHKYIIFQRNKAFLSPKKIPEFKYERRRQTIP